MDSALHLGSISLVYSVRGAMADARRSFKDHMAARHARFHPAADLFGRHVLVRDARLPQLTVVCLQKLQPLLFGRHWIVDGVPWWVAAATHLVYGWTILLLVPVARPFAPPRATP